MCNVDNWTTFILAIMRPSGVAMAAKFGHRRPLQMDATFGTNNLKFPLFTILVVDDHGQGIPVAWMLCSRELTECIMTLPAGLQTAGEQQGFSLVAQYDPGSGALNDSGLLRRCRNTWLSGSRSCFLVDASDAEIAAIVAAFGSAVKIFLCHWHVQRAWLANLCAKVNSCPCALHPPSHFQ